MSYVIDHDVRRAELAEIAANLIAKEGMAAATVRRVAAEAGFSTTVVTHYFANKDDLLLKVYQESARCVTKRINEILDIDPTDIYGCIRAMLPINEEATRGWRVTFAFWNKALINEEFQDEQRWWTRRTEEVLLQVLNAWLGCYSSNAMKASDLVTLMHGIAIRASFETDWTEERQCGLIRAEIERFTEGVPLTKHRISSQKSKVQEKSINTNPVVNGK